MKVDGRRARPLVTSGSPGPQKASKRPAHAEAASSFTPAPPPPPPWTHPGLAEYTPEQQRFITTLQAGKSTMSTRFRAALEGPAVAALSPKDQLLAGLTAAVPELVAPEPRTVLATPPAHELSAATLEPAWTFHGATAPAEVFELTIDGQHIKIARPADGKYEGNQHTLDDVVRTLVDLPAPSRAQIKSVSLNPVKNPEDAFWAQTYGTSDFASYMTCGADGEVTIYPPTVLPLDEMRASMTHETGHAWSMARWGQGGTGPKWDAWVAASNSDGVAVSTYGQSSLLEDVAEATALYLESKGQPSFAEYRALYPGRFAILDRELGGQP